VIQHGFLRVGSAVPKVRVADCDFNAGRVIGLLQRAQEQNIAVLVFPELCLTAYTCSDLFHQPPLLQAARDALTRVIESTATSFAGVAIVGVPLVVDERLFNCAAVIHRGELLGVVPKSYLPNYKEFYEARWFTPGTATVAHEMLWEDEVVRFGTDLLFAASDADGLVLGVEICEDLWVPIPPSSHQALAGANVMVNLSASNETIGKAAYRRQLVCNQSARCVAGYIYTSCGVWESTTDVVFGGHGLIAENGVLLAESERFQQHETLLAADLDLERLLFDRLRTNSFAENARQQRDLSNWVVVDFELERPAEAPARLMRTVDAHPFVPQGTDRLSERCQEIFQTQVAGLAKRLEHIGKPNVAIGISGGLDSTLSLLVTCKTFDLLGVPRARILAYTMPGFGTTSRTRTNAHALMKQLGVTGREVDIRPLCLEEMRALGHAPFKIPLEALTLEALTAKLHQVPAAEMQDLIFENIQARMRTSILMNAGFVVGTGDVSEAALGWSTYNGDHMSMYNPNASIPKTLVKFLVSWVAQNEFEGEARRTLLDIVATDISPELLPTGGDSGQIQATESVVGPYELNDFFLFHFLRFGAAPEKILYLTGQTSFARTYQPEEIRRWLQLFIKRFFANQFKRSCVPDGPKVGSISLSPRGDWRMPSDAAATLWLEWAEKENPALDHKDKK
jgi:NAD+ synthase (glutamine-hydrolysing)